MKHVFKSIVYCLLGLALLGWISFLLIGIMYSNPGADHAMTTFFGDYLIISEQLEKFNRTFKEVSNGLFMLTGLMNSVLLGITIAASIGWSVVSHYLNIDAPGKAKIYFIHWAIFSGIFVGIILSTTLFFLNSSRFTFNAFIGTNNESVFVVVTAIYYSLVYYLGTIFGTARFARSSVLFANKLPGNL